MRKLGAAAERFISEHGAPASGCRFDVVEVGSLNGRLAVSDVIKDAFTL
jgi:Holliday junction resolvase-like predicted endonuclease